MDNEKHAQGVKITLEEMIGTDLSLRRKNKNKNDLNKEMFEKTINALERANVRTAIVGTEFNIDLSNQNNGYFDERFFNTKDLDVLDYINKLRKKGVYTPANYNPTIGSGFKKSYNPIRKIGFKDIPDKDNSVSMSYAYFFHNNKYIPGQNDPAGVTQDQLLTSLQTLQKNYAKK